MNLEPSLPPTAENLLNNFDRREAGIVNTLITNYKSTGDMSDQAMTDVARHIFLMYHLDPGLIAKAMYGDFKKSKAVRRPEKGRIKSIEIYITKERSPEGSDIGKAYGDTLLHEMLHALVYVWNEEYGDESHVGHSSKETKKQFGKCKQLLANAIAIGESNS